MYLPYREEEKIYTYVDSQPPMKIPFSVSGCFETTDAKLADMKCPLYSYWKNSTHKWNQAVQTLVKGLTLYSILW